MNVLVVYDSQFGNTRTVAETMSEAISGTIVPMSELTTEKLKNADLIIVGSPIQGWRPTQKTMETLSSLPENALEGKSVAAFDTRIKIFFSGSASDKIEKMLMERGGRSIIAPEKFYVVGKEGPLVAGELNRAVVWAKEVKKKAEDGLTDEPDLSEEKSQ